MSKPVNPSPFMSKSSPFYDALLGDPYDDPYARRMGGADPNRPPDVVIVSRQTIARVDDLLVNLETGLAELEQDLNSPRRVSSDSEARMVEHNSALAEDAASQREAITEIRASLRQGGRDPRPHVVWSVE